MEAQMTQFIEQLLTMLQDLTYVAYAAPLVVLLVNTVKRLAGDRQWNWNLIHLAVQVAVWGGIAVAQQAGYEAQVQEGIELVVPLLEKILPLVVSLFVGKAIYENAAARDIPAFGYRRS